RIAGSRHRAAGVDVHDLADRADRGGIQCHAVPARVFGKRVAGIERNELARPLKRIFANWEPAVSASGARPSTVVNSQNRARVGAAHLDLRVLRSLWELVI